MNMNIAMMLPNARGEGAARIASERAPSAELPFEAALARADAQQSPRTTKEHTPQEPRSRDATSGQGGASESNATDAAPRDAEAPVEQDETTASEVDEKPVETPDAGREATIDDSAEASQVVDAAFSNAEGVATGEHQAQPDAAMVKEGVAPTTDNATTATDSPPSAEVQPAQDANVALTKGDPAATQTAIETEATTGELSPTIPVAATSDSGHRPADANLAAPVQVTPEASPNAPQDFSQPQSDARGDQPPALPANQAQVEPEAEVQPTVEAAASNPRPAPPQPAIGVEPTPAATTNAPLSSAAASTTNAPASTGAATAPTPLPTNDADADVDAANVARVARGLQSALQQQGGTVTLRLNPPELGFVRIELELANGTVSATLQSETSSVRQLLTHQLAQLRQGLENQGLSVERLNVQSLPNTSAQQHAQGEGQQNAARDGAHDGRSRGQYAGDDSRGGDRDARDPRRDRGPRTFAELVNELA